MNYYIDAPEIKKVADTNYSIIDEIDDLISSNKINWGILPYECLHYVEEKTGMKLLDGCYGEKNKNTVGIARKYMKNKHVKLRKTFSDIHEVLLQPGRGRSSFYNGTKRKKRGNIKTRSLVNGSYILSKDRKSAFARLFFEIEEDYDEMKNRNIVGKNCGYALLRKMYQGDIYLDDLKKTCPISSSIDRYRFDNRITKLINFGAIISDGDGMVALNKDVKYGFDFSFRSGKKIENWKHRLNWFMPTKKTID